ncbi:MAG: outer membrane protein [Rhodomicrobium sp.]
MKRIYAGLIGLTAASALALSANAADMYPGPGGYKDVSYPAVWAGFYGGANIGYGWSEASDQLACGAACVAGASVFSSFSGVSPAGWLEGLQFGYNWQGFGYSSLVLGIETDVAAASVYGQGSDAAGDFYHSRLEALGTVRGRIGYAMDRTLLYFTGGLAWGTMFNEAVAPSGAPDFTTNPTSVGYVLGGGVEYKFWRDLSVKVEYQYVDLGKNNPVDTGGTGTYTANGGTVRDDAFSVVRVGFNWWPFPAYQSMK